MEWLLGRPRNGCDILRAASGRHRRPGTSPHAGEERQQGLPFGLLYSFPDDDIAQLITKLQYIKFLAEGREATGGSDLAECVLNLCRKGQVHELTASGLPPFGQSTQRSFRGQCNDTIAHVILLLRPLGQPAIFRLGADEVHEIAHGQRMLFRFKYL